MGSSFDDQWRQFENSRYIPRLVLLRQRSDKQFYSIIRWYKHLGSVLLTLARWENQSADQCRYNIPNDQYNFHRHVSWDFDLQSHYYKKTDISQQNWNSCLIFETMLA